MGKEQAEQKFKAQEDYAKRNKEGGLVRTTIWVPEALLDDIKDVGLLMRQGTWVPLAPDEKPVLNRTSRTKRGKK